MNLLSHRIECHQKAIKLLELYRSADKKGNSYFESCISAGARGDIKNNKFFREKVFFMNRVRQRIEKKYHKLIKDMEML